MKKISLYTTSYCPYCHRAKRLLDELGQTYTEIDLTDNDELRRSLTEKYNWYTVPMIMIGEEFIGGFDQLQALHNSNKLETKIHS